MIKLTQKQERFCQEIVKGKSQSDAYRLAFKPKRMKDKSIHEKASQYMAEVKIRSRITEIQAPVLAKVRVTREEWLEKMQAFFYSDVRKMFDEFGNPIEIPHLQDNEAAMVEGFEFCEEYTKVKKADGETDAVPTGYTKKYKLTPKLKAMLEFGKVMGWYDAGEQPKGPQRVFIRTWVKEEHNHVHLHAHGNAGIIGMHDSGAEGTVPNGAGLEGEQPEGSSADRSDGSDCGRTGNGVLPEPVQAEVQPADPTPTVRVRVREW
jgi:hypothetical protein